MKLTVLDRNDVRAVSKECEDALKAVAARYGLNLKVGTRHFTGKDVRFRVELSIAEVSSTGETLTPEALAFKRSAYAFGLSPDMLGKEFKTFQGTYQITGLKVASRKYPILAKDIRTGKTYKFPVNALTMWFANNPLKQVA